MQNFNFHKMGGVKNLSLKFEGMLFFTVFFALTDFAKFLNPVFPTFLLLLVILGRFFSGNLIFRAGFYIVNYTLIVLIGAAVNGGEINWLLVVPVIAYLYGASISDRSFNFYRISYGFACITYFVFCVCVLELLIKLNFFESAIYSSFISEYGDGRFDVLRTRSLFGSSLSTAAFSVVTLFFWSHVNPRWLFSSLSFLIALLSGSRTAFILCTLIFLFSPVFINSISKKFILIKILTILLMTFIVNATLGLVNFDGADRVYSIVLRSLDVSMDESFIGRGETSLVTFHYLVDALPLSLFIGLEKDFVSDSAFISIAAKSGIILAFVFHLLLVFFVLRSKILFASKVILVIVSLLGSVMIGDMFVPSVTFLIFSVIFIYKIKNLSVGLIQGSKVSGLIT